MITFLKVLAVTLVGLLAPIVTLVYRGGWFNTPDDTVSPRGLGNEKMRRILAKWGPYWSDWWWLGVRNRACGLAYALKPAVLKGLIYCSLVTGDLKRDVQRAYKRRKWGWVRRTTVLGYSEWAVCFLWKGEGLFHVLYGYRMAPIWNEIVRNVYSGLTTWDVPHREINMDARPVLSFRSGAPD